MRFGVKVGPFYASTSTRRQQPKQREWRRLPCGMRALTAPGSDRDPLDRGV